VIESHACFLLGIVMGCFLIPLFWLAVEGVFWAVWYIVDWFDTRAVVRIQEREMAAWIKAHPHSPRPLSWPMGTPGIVDTAAWR